MPYTFRKNRELDLLHRFFGTIITTPEVATEYGLQLPPWIKIQNSSDKNYQSIIEISVDIGEASAIALAIELADCLLIIDDLKGRKFAANLGLNIIGSAGIIVDAKLSGLIPSVKPILQKMKETNFRISEKLEHLILTKSGE